MMTRSSRRVTLAVMTLVLVFLAAPIAQAKKNYPPRTPSCSVSPMQVYKGGQTVTVTGKNYTPNSTVRIYFSQTTPTPSSPGTLIYTVTTDSSGNFSIQTNTLAASGRKAYIDCVGPAATDHGSTAVQVIVTLRLVNTVQTSATAPLSVSGSALVGLGFLGLFLGLSVAHRRRARALRA
jgi:hypothetical protein